MNVFNDDRELQKAANAFARTRGYGRATEITLATSADEMRIGKTVSYGYRKITTGEYVAHAYRRKFGWKNTYYQSAVCEVIVPASWVAGEGE